jgi:hypothetical protein
MAKKYKGATVFDRAEAALEDHGWCQGEYEMLDGKVCLMGALNIGLGFQSDPGELRIGGSKQDKRRLEAVNILASTITRGKSDKWTVDEEDYDFEETFPSAESIAESKEAEITRWNDKGNGWWYGNKDRKRHPSEVKNLLRKSAKKAAASGNKLLTYP